MTEPTHTLELLKLAAQFGLSGVVLVIWWLSDRSRERQIQQYRDDMTHVLQIYQKDMAEQRAMYNSNVDLVRGYHTTATDLKDVVMMNTQSMTHLAEAIAHNQFCPMVRLKKASSGREE